MDAGPSAARGRGIVPSVSVRVFSASRPGGCPCSLALACLPDSLCVTGTLGANAPAPVCRARRHSAVEKLIWHHDVSGSGRQARIGGILSITPMKPVRQWGHWRSARLRGSGLSGSSLG